MKSILLLLILGLSATVFAQHKSEFGFVLKAGNFALPYRKTAFKRSPIETDHTTRQSFGEAYSMGIWYLRPIGKHVRIYGSLLYQTNWITKAYIRERKNPTGSYFADFKELNRHKIHEHGLSIPVKIYFPLEKVRNITLGVGTGLSRILSAYFIALQKSQFSGFPESSKTVEIKVNNWRDFKTTFLLSAEISYLVDPKTTIALEYRFEKRSGLNLVRRAALSDSLVDCLCFPNETEYRPQMNSFSVSLRHNILD